MNPSQPPPPIMDWVSIAESLATISAIILGGAWSYLLFIRNRQIWPRVTISLAASHFSLDASNVLLRVQMRVSNIGQVLLQVESLSTVVSQILPLPSDFRRTVKSGHDPVHEAATEVNWPVLAARSHSPEPASCEIEPGEEQTFQFDFVLPSRVTLVELYSCLLNKRKRKRNLAWDATVLYDVSTGQVRMH